MAKFSKHGWSSDFKADNFTDDQLERFKEGVLDDMACRHDSSAKPRRIHEVPGYIKGFGTVGLIKTDFNTDCQRAQSGDPQACLRVGRVLMHRKGSLQQAVAYLEWALEKGVKEAKGPLDEARRHLSS